MNQESKGECALCDDPEGDLLCEACAEKIYGEDDTDEDDDVFGTVGIGSCIIFIVFIVGVIFGYAWGMISSVHVF